VLVCRTVAHRRTPFALLPLPNRKDPMDQLHHLMEHNRRKRRVVFVISSLLLFATVVGVALWLGS
jgi:hypothetical protein